jgi:hypothetical protein
MHYTLYGRLTNVTAVLKSFVYIISNGLLANMRQM